MPEWQQGDVYLKTTDKEGGVSFTEHRAWHVERFVKNCHANATKEGGQVEQISRDEFKAATQRNRGADHG